MEKHIPARTSPQDFALNKQEIRRIYDIVDPPEPFEEWYAELDPWNRGSMFASHLKNYLCSKGFTKWDEIDRLAQDLNMKDVDEVPKVFPELT